MSPRSAYALALALLVGCAHGANARLPGPNEPLTADHLLQLAEAMERAGDPLRAQQYLLAALRAGANEKQALPRLLRLYVADGQYRLAIEHAADSLRRHPNDRELRVFLSTLYTAVGEDDEAIAQYERVLASSPNDAYTHYALASLLHDAGREAQRADTHFRAYLELEPQGPYAEEARELLLKSVP
jgi:tetratricopeptide (TPR) repeat protein